MRPPPRSTALRSCPHRRLARAARPVPAGRAGAARAQHAGRRPSGTPSPGAAAASDPGARLGLILTADRALPHDEPEPEIDHRRGRSPAVEQPEQQPAGAPPDLGGIGPRWWRGAARIGGRSRNRRSRGSARPPAPGCAAPAFHHGAEGRDVGDEEQSLGAAAAQEFGHRLGAVGEGARRPSVMQDQIVRETGLGEAVAQAPQRSSPRKSRTSPSDPARARRCGWHRGPSRPSPRAGRPRSSKNPTARSKRRLGAVPDLHHRHPGAGQKVAGRGRMLHARHHDRVRAAR